jgi:hypothetical protein
MPDNVIANEQVTLPDIPLTEEELLAWLAARKKQEEEEKNGMADNN